MDVIIYSTRGDTYDDKLLKQGAGTLRIAQILQVH